MLSRLSLLCKKNTVYDRPVTMLLVRTFASDGRGAGAKVYENMQEEREFKKKIMDNNKKWAKEQITFDDHLPALCGGIVTLTDCNGSFDLVTNNVCTTLRRRAASQHPEALFIGCADSRVPAETLLGCKPGDLFVHRNVANLVAATDMSMLSVLQFSVEVLKVKHIVVMGHYGCGGVKAALSPQRFGLLDNWTRNIRDVVRLHEKEIFELSDEEDEIGESERHRRLVELNVKEQCINLLKSGIIQTARIEMGFPLIHGFVYSMRDGIIKEVDADLPGQLRRYKHIYKLYK